MSLETPRISELHLERFFAGELSPAEAEKIERAAASDPELAARLEAIGTSNEDILAAYPPATMAPRIEARAAAAVRRPSPLWILPAAAILAIGLGIGVVGHTGLFSGSPGLDDTRAKGASLHLSLFRKTASGAEELADGATVHASDLLQVGYYSGAKGYGAIFSIDGRGTLTFHLPAGYAGGPGRAPAIETTGEALLPSAYELDDAPRFERFFFVFSEKPFGLQELEKAALNLAADPPGAESGKPALAGGLTWCSTIVSKGPKS